MLRRNFIGGVLALAASGARADGAAQILGRLNEPRTHAIMRHALAPGTGDPDIFTLRDCATQRNLDGRGREQARRAGEMVRDAGARIDRVLSSQWCRCLDTARLLALGEIEEEPALNSFFEDRSRRRPQTADLRARLTATPDSETLFMVTHQVNITALTGRGVTSGEIFVIRTQESGEVDVVGRVSVPI